MHVKKCRKCGTEQPLGNYYKHPRMPDGHLNHCKSCFLADSKRRYKEKTKDKPRVRVRPTTPERVKQQKRADYLRNKEQILSKNREYRERNKESIARRRKARRLANRQKVLEQKRNHYHRKKTYYKALSATRKAKKLLAMPKWANAFFISEIYDLAARRTALTGIEWHVDHIIPLRNSIVCGLHVENNLQVITKSENLSKGNRYWPGMP